jgi:hypothetical protein
MFLKKLAIAFALLASTLACHAQLITSFGFTAENGGFTWNYDPNTSTISGTEGFGDLLYGTPANASLLEGNTYISLTGSATIAPPGVFYVQLEDSGGNIAVATFLWSSFTGGPQTVQAALDYTSFDFEDVVFWNLNSGASLQPVNASFSEMSAVAVPEPSTLLLAGGAMFFFAFRRRPLMR